jgi:hypothetical protein
LTALEFHKHQVLIISSPSLHSHISTTASDLLVPSYIEKGGASVTPV